MATSIPWRENFQRTYKITFGTRDVPSQAVYIVPELIAIPNESATTEMTEAIPSNAISFNNLTNPRGFDFSFDSSQVASSASASSEKSNLVLNNLSVEDERILLQPNCVVIIEAGYEGHLTLCYTGDVTNVTPLKNPPDISYKIQLVASGNAILNTMISTHYDEDLSMTDVVLDMAKRFPATSVATYGLNEYNTRYKTGGRGYTGTLIKNFEDLLYSQKLDYVFSNNKIYIIPYRLKGQDYQDFSKTNFTLSEASIKQVSNVTDNTQAGNGDVQLNIKKWQVNTFYLPIEVGQFITIPNTTNLRKYAGTYIVKGKRVILQSKGAAWDVVLEVEELPQ